MAGFATRDDLITEAVTNGKVDYFTFARIAPSSGTNNVWHSLWKGTGGPAAGADPATTPGTVYDADQATVVAGSIWFPDRSTDQRYLLTLNARADFDCTLLLYDRLVGVSGIALTAIGAQTVNSSALSRYTATAAINNEVWFELTTALSVTAAVVHLDSYTSADGTTAQTGGSLTFPSTTTKAGLMVQLPLDASKDGVRSIEAGLNVDTASTTGIGNVIIIRPLARMALRANQWNEINFLDDLLTLPRVFDNAVLSMAILDTATNTATVTGTLTCVYG